MLVIRRIYNNNIVLAVDDAGEEVIATGAGVGYLTGRGRPVDESRIERMFRMTGLAKSGAFRVLLELPYEVISATTHISTLLKQRHGIVLTPTLEVALADHLAQALKRVEAGQPIYNSMLWETKMTYPAEFAIALEVLEDLHNELGTRLPLDEAGFITIHLAGAGLAGDPERAMSLGRALHDVVELVENELGITVDPSGPSTTRFLTHVKFVIQRLTHNKAFAGSFDEIFQTLKRQYPDTHACATHIGEYLQKQFNTSVTEEEELYLMLHLRRLQDDVAGPEVAADATE